MNESGQLVDSELFGAGPRTDPPAANANRDTFVAESKGPNSDGSLNFHMTTASGAYIAGPNAGLRFTTYSFELKGWSSPKGVQMYGSSELPVIRTVTLSYGSKFERIAQCLSS